MAENTEFEALMKKILESPQEVVGAPPVVEEETTFGIPEEAFPMTRSGRSISEGLTSLLGGARGKAGDILQRIGETLDPGIPEEAFPATTRRELERKRIPPPVVEQKMVPPPELVADEPLEVIPSMMDIIYKKETGSFPDPFIRTEVEGTDTDAFGPAQLRKGILEDLVKYPAVLELTDDEEKLRIKLIDQSKEFDRFNKGDIKDPDFGPGGKGVGLSDDEKIIYRSLAEKALLVKATQRGYDINNLSSEQSRSLIGDWFSKTDPRRPSYIQEAIKGIPIKTLVGARIIEPPSKKPTKRKRTGGMISRNPYPYNPRPI